MPLVFGRRLRLSAGVGLPLVLAATALLAPRVDAQPGARSTPEPSVAERLADARSLARTDPSSAARVLRRMDPAALEPADEDAWYDLARTVALRTGDKAWLLSLQDHQPEFSTVDLHRVLLAGGLLEEGRIDDARAELSRIEDLEAVNVRDRRRAYALRARIAWLEGDVPGERAAIEKIVHELQYWDSASCQRCHSDPSHPGSAPLLEVRSAWYGRRFVALMMEQGDAAAVREAAASALAADPADTHARLRIAYASVALGLESEADDHFAMIEWLKLPGRTGGTPRMMAPYP